MKMNICVATALCMALCGSVQAATVTVQFSSVAQTMDGFGAGQFTRDASLLSGMAEPQKTEVYDLIFKDLGATFLGVMVHPEFQPSNGAAYAWDNPIFVQQREVIGAALSRGVVSQVWAKVSSPPAWMKDSGSVTGG